MIKKNTREENDLISFIKDWLKVHGYSQKDLATNLNINSRQISEIIKKINELHKKGGYFNVARKLIEIEQKWLRDGTSRKNINEENHLNNLENYSEKQTGSYSQLDIDYKVDLDLLINRMNNDFKA